VKQINVVITEECLERLRKEGSERIEVEDCVVHITLSKKLKGENPAGYKGKGCYVKALP
jgi:hypothetical protein